MKLPAVSEKVRDADSTEVARTLSAPRFTVYVPSHNYGRFLSGAVESVLRQSVQDWELIVIDDGSEDDTARVMQLYRGHPQISLHHTGGIGLPAVCNFALHQARGEYVIRLDGDDVFDENILLVLGNYLDQNQDVALVFPDYYLMDDDGEVFWHERRARLYSEDHMMDAPPNGAGTLVRREALQELGGYREDLGAQDGFDLWSRIHERYKCANINLPLFYYRRHGSNLTTNTQHILMARREIKKDAIRAKLEALRPVIAVIPCRRNYDFEVDLWKQEINGQTLLEREIQVCTRSELFDHIVVACDNPEAERLVRNSADRRLQFFLRNPKDTIRSASIVTTMEKVARHLDPDFEGITTVSYIQTPFVSAGTLEEAVTTLVMSGADSSRGVEEIKSDLYRRTAHGLEIVNRRLELGSRSNILYRDAQTCVATLNRNLRNGSLTGPAIASFEMSSAESFFIGAPEDLAIARISAENGK